MVTPLGFAEMTIEWELDGDDDPFAVVIGVETDLSNFSPVEHCDGVMANTVAAWNTVVSDDASITRVRGSFGQDAADDIIVESTLTPIAGGSTGQKLPQNCALLVRKRTALGGRRNRGRSYLPAILTETAVSQTGVIDNAGLADFQDRADDWLDLLATEVSGVQPATPMVILHAPSALSAVPAPTPVSSLQVDAVIATQRRRLRR